MNPPPNISMEMLEELNTRYSIGTSAMVATILPLLASPKVPYDTILINLETIMRNVYHKDLTVDKLVSATIREYVDFMSEIMGTIGNNSSIKKMYVAMYIGDHIATLPYRSRKKETPKRIIFKKAVERIQKKRELFFRRVVDNVDFHGFTLSTLRRVATQIAWQVSKLVGSTKLLMISHIPLDFHVLQRHPNSAILESYTGRIIKYSPMNLGRKVFKLDNVPFTTYTHAILGDNVSVSLIKDHNMKKKILTLASEHNWKMASRETVNRDIRENVGFPPFIAI